LFLELNETHFITGWLRTDINS